MRSSIEIKISLWRQIIMTELEMLEAGLEYCYDDSEVQARKENKRY